MNPNNDPLLWKRFKEGDRDAFSAIYNQYFANLIEYGLRLADDRELLKDTIHDLFVKLWANKANLGDVKNIKSYLLVSLRGALFNKKVQLQKNKSVEIEDEHVFKLTFAEQAARVEKDNLSQQSQRLLDALNSLTPRQKEIIYLKYFEELDYDQVAEMLHITVKATYKLSARALDTLREIMGGTEMPVLLAIALVKIELLSW